VRRPEQPHPYADEPGSPGGRAIALVLFVGSAALVAAVLDLAFREPMGMGVVVGAVLTALLLRWLSRRRLRRLLQSGDVASILERWSSALDRIPHAATMGPLMTATAFAAYGWVERARAAMAAAERGPAWDAALEHRLFLDALLLTFEGDREAAVERATRLERLPLPATGRALRHRVRVLRRAVAALARAFAHCSLPGDRQLLESASEASPLVFWAMRYGAAVIAIDEGAPERAAKLLQRAPAWPEESAFRAFHQEIIGRAGATP
jgi:hypothetical protein